MGTGRVWRRNRGKFEVNPVWNKNDLGIRDVIVVLLPTLSLYISREKGAFFSVSNTPIHL